MILPIKQPLFVVALDHIPLGVMKGWENAGETLKVITSGKADCLILNFGIIKLFKELLTENNTTKFILRLDGSPSYLVEDWRTASRWDMLYTLDDATRLGASAVIVNLLVGSSVEMQSVITASKIASAALERNLPVFISAIPPVNTKNDNDDLDVSIFAARFAAEIGADVVNTYYSGNMEGLSRIVSVCPAPVILAGGNLNSDEQTIKRAYVAMQSGCSGICFGRSIWQSKSPKLVMEALRVVLNDPSSLDEILATINKQ